MNKQKIKLNKFDIISLIMCFAFSVFNAFLGIYYLSIWNGTISVYYIFLLLIRLIILINESKIKDYEEDKKIEKRNKLFYISFIFLIILDISLIVPITLMVFNERSYIFGLIPAISLAAYTTYKITATIITYKRNRSNENISFRELKALDLIDAIISILTLQNTLIIANNGFDNKMYILICITSFIAILFIITITIVLFVRVRIYNKNKRA